MKTNFQKKDVPPSEIKDKDDIIPRKKDLTQKEFEDYITKSGAKGSFMVYRSTKKEDELGLDEI